MVRSFSGLERVLAFPGVVQAEVYFEVGETIRPVRLDGDRRGYVIAVGATNVEALERAEAATRGLGSVERDRRGPTRHRGRMSCGFDADHYRELLEAAKAGRLPVRALRRGAGARATSSSATTSISTSRPPS